MNKQKLEIKAFHFFNGLAWIIALLLFVITDRARPQERDIFTVRFEDLLDKTWDQQLIAYGWRLLIVLSVICVLGLIANVMMSTDTDRRFSVTQTLITVITLIVTIFYFVTF